MTQVDITVEIMYNDSKLHQKKVVEEWDKFGIDVWPGAGKSCWDRDNRVEFPVDFPKFIPVDENPSHLEKICRGGLYARWNRKNIHKSCGGFYNDVGNSLNDIPQKFFQNAIDAQRNIHLECHKKRKLPIICIFTIEMQFL